MSHPPRTSWSTLVLAAVLVVIAAGMLTPAIPFIDGPRRNANLGSNMRQVLIASLCYASESERPGQVQVWPHDDHMLIAWSDGELPEKLFRDPRHPDLKPAWIYVRPAAKPSSNQPVLVSDPRCTDGRGCWIAYADGHIGIVKNPAIWSEAGRLAALPKAAAEGIDGADWGIWIERKR